MIFMLLPLHLLLLLLLTLLLLPEYTVWLMSSNIRLDVLKPMCSNSRTVTIWSYYYESLSIITCSLVESSLHCTGSNVNVYCWTNTSVALFSIHMDVSAKPRLCGVTCVMYAHDGLQHHLVLDLASLWHPRSTIKGRRGNMPCSSLPGYAVGVSAGYHYCLPTHTNSTCTWTREKSIPLCVASLR